MSSTPKADALPVQRREVLEMMDLSIKLYRRNFWLVAFSAICTAFSFGGFALYFFVAPFAYGPAACAIAAAVRGQSVGFRDGWRFTTRRYGVLLGQVFLSYLLWGAILFALTIAVVIAFAGAAAGLSSAGLPSGLQTAFYVVAGLLTLALFSIVSAVGTASVCMAPMIACLEEDQRNTAIARSFSLLKGNLWRAILLYSLVGLSALVFMAMVGGGVAAVAGIPAILDAFRGRASDASLAAAFMSMAVLWGLATLFWQPFVYLLSGLFCLDLRVRREALDLEWQAHLAGHPAPAADLTAAHPQSAPPLEGQAPPQFQAALSQPMPGEDAVRTMAFGSPSQVHPSSVFSTQMGAVPTDFASEAPGGAVQAETKEESHLWQTVPPVPVPPAPPTQPSAPVQHATWGMAAPGASAVPTVPAPEAAIDSSWTTPAPPGAGSAAPEPHAPSPPPSAAPAAVWPTEDEPEDYPASSFGGAPRP